MANYERDPLFWASDVEGMSFVRTTSGAVGFLMLSIAWRLRNVGWLRAMSIWQIGPAPHLWLVQASSHIVFMLGKGNLIGSSLLDVPSVSGTYTHARQPLQSQVLAYGAVLSSGPWRSCAGANSLFIR